MDLVSSIILVFYTLCSLILLLYGLNNYIMIYLFMRKRNANKQSDAETEARFARDFENPESLPIVTTQIPLYNEINVAERVIRAVAEIEYPKDRHEIQVLDDSNDETIALVDQVAADLRKAGHWIEVFRRDNRVGYKAGAKDF